MVLLYLYVFISSLLKIQCCCWVKQLNHNEPQEFLPCINCLQSVHVKKSVLPFFLKTGRVAFNLCSVFIFFCLFSKATEILNLTRNEQEKWKYIHCCFKFVNRCSYASVLNSLCSVLKDICMGEMSLIKLKYNEAHYLQLTSLFKSSFFFHLSLLFFLYSVKSTRKVTCVWFQCGHCSAKCNSELQHVSVLAFVSEGEGWCHVLKCYWYLTS